MSDNTNIECNAVRKVTRSVGAGADVGEGSWKRAVSDGD